MESIINVSPHMSSPPREKLKELKLVKEAMLDPKFKKIYRKG